MAKATMASGKALKSGFGIQEGIVKVDDARYKLIQRVKKDGDKVTPMCVLQWDVQRSDKDGNTEGDIEQKDFIYCWGSKEAQEDGTHKFSFHPANGTGIDDMDPEDQGAEIDTEGNTLVPTGNATAAFEDSDAMLLSKSLELAGFKSEVLDQCWAPSFAGMILEVTTVPKADLCKKFGVKYTPREGQKDTVWDVKKIHVFPYAKKGKQESKGAGKANGKAKEEAGDKGGGGGEVDETAQLAEATVRKVLETKEFKGKEGVARSKFQAAVMTQLHRDKKQKEQSAVMKLVKDDEWIVGLGAAIDGFLVDTDEGTVSYTE